MSGQKRFVAYDESGNRIGRFVGSTSDQAVPKAFTKMMQNSRNNNPQDANPSIQNPRK